MNYALCPPLRVPEGQALAGGSMETYLAGTSTPLATYADDVGTANPTTIPLNTSGRPDGAVYLATTDANGNPLAYKFIVKDANGATVYTQDNVRAGEGQVHATLGTVSREITSILSDARVSVLDYIPESLHASIAARNCTTPLETYIEAAMTAAVVANRRLYFPGGKYPISAPVIGQSLTRVAVEGELSAIAYNSGDCLSVIQMLPGFLAGEPALDFRYATKVAVHGLGFECQAATTAIEFGERTGYTGTYGNNAVTACSILGGDYGIRARNAGLLKGYGNNVSGQTIAGIALIEGCGDFDLAENYVNTINVDYTGTDLYTGSGILVAAGSSNGNIRGGKIEWCAKGIMIYGSNGVNVTGVNFDVNRWCHAYIAPIDATTQACRAIDFTGCRFLAGGTAAGKGQASVYVLAGNSTAAQVTVNGGSMHKGGDLAYDYNTGANIGPATYGVRADTSGSGTADVLCVGVDMVGCAGVNTAGASGAGASVRLIGCLTDLPNFVTGGGTVHRNDAEEGTWTPTLAGLLNAGAQTYATQAGRYVKHGSLVTASFHIALSFKDATTDGDIAVAGLPYAAANVTGLRHGCAIGAFGNITLDVGDSQLVGYVEQGESRIRLFQVGSGNVGLALPYTGITSTTFICGTVSYVVD